MKIWYVVDAIYNLDDIKIVILDIAYLIYALPVKIITDCHHFIYMSYGISSA